MEKKQKTVSQILDEVVYEICDKYCRFPRELKDDEELYGYCERCPLNKLGI